MTFDPQAAPASAQRRPESCCDPGCGHDRFDHLATGRCRRCRCPKYEPPPFLW